MYFPTQLPFHLLFDLILVYSRLYSILIWFVWSQWNVSVCSEQAHQRPQCAFFSRGRMEWLTWFPAPPRPTFFPGFTSDASLDIYSNPSICSPSVSQFPPLSQSLSPFALLLSCLPLPPWAPCLPPPPHSLLCPLCIWLDLCGVLFSSSQKL